MSKLDAIKGFAVSSIAETLTLKVRLFIRVLFALAALIFSVSYCSDNVTDNLQNKKIAQLEEILKGE